MPNFELETVRNLIGPTAPASRYSDSPEPTTTLSGVAPGHALFDTPPPGSQPEILERSQRSRRPTRRNVQWSVERTQSRERSEKVNRTRTRNANRGRRGKTARRSQSRRIQSSPDATDGESYASEATTYSKGPMETAADRSDMVVRVPETGVDDDEDYDYETLMLIPRDKLLEELGATQDNYLQVCPDDELRVLVHRARNYQQSYQPATSSQAPATGSQAGTIRQEITLDVAKQCAAAVGSPPREILLSIGGGHHLAYPPSKDPSVSHSPGPSSRPKKRPFMIQSMSESSKRPRLPGDPTSIVDLARSLSLSPLHDHPTHRRDETQFEDTATQPEDTATQPENTAMDLDYDSEPNPFLLRPVPRPAEAIPSLRSSPSNGTVVPTSRPMSDRAKSTSLPGSQHAAAGSQNTQSHLLTPLASPPPPTGQPPPSPQVGVTTLLKPNNPPRAPSSSPSLGGAPNGTSAPSDARRPSTHITYQGMQLSPTSPQNTAALINGRTSTSAHSEMVRRPVPSHSAPALLTTHRSRPPATPQSEARGTPSHRSMRPFHPSPNSSLSGSNRGARLARLSVPAVPLLRESTLEIPSAPVDRRVVPSSLMILLADARGELNAPQVPEAQPGPSSHADRQAVSPEATRARADACIDMRGCRHPGDPPTSQASAPAQAPAQAPAPRPTRAAAQSNIMLDNDTERRAAEAERTGKYFNGRKLKPLARDVTGNARQVLVIAKSHFFIFILIHGPYETRITYLIWARGIFELTWRQQFPDLPFEWPEVDVAEIMVNYLPTLRGRVKEELRSVVELFIKFHNPVCDDAQLEANRVLYKLVHPLGFYCLEFEPRAGHYQSEIIPRAIAKALFQGPYDVGVLYSHYFVSDRIPENITCFILANLQFCLEEWSTGRFKAGDLGDGHMYQKYVAHKVGIKRLRNRARSRYLRLHKEWFVYCKNYSGAAFVSEVQTQLTVDPSEIREDTPATEIDENEEPVLFGARA